MPVLAGLLAAVLGAVHLVLLPHSGTDLAAQVARASFARDAPLTPVDLSWYAGVHPYAYSLLSPAVMAALGVGLAGVVAAVGGAVLLALLLRGAPHPLLGALAGAVFSVADVVSGRTTFALGAVAALGALLLLKRLPWACLLAMLSGLLSPVAAAFLGLAALVLVLHRRPGGWLLGLAASVPVVVLAVLFPSGGIQPYRPSSAGWAVAAAALIAVLSRSPLLRTGSLIYGLAVVALVFTRDPFGSNVLRLAVLLAAPLLLAWSRRPLLLAVVAALAVGQWQVRPTLADLRATPAPTFRALDRALLRLDARRVEVVPLRDHGEAAEVARVVPLARGWSRQIDYADNALFYRGILTPATYRTWLLAHAVDTVALPLDSPVDMGGRREAALLQADLTGLQPVWSDRHWQVWKVVGARPLVTAPATVLSAGRTTLLVRSEVAATVDVDVRWSRWLSVTGPACVERRGDRTRLVFRSSGVVVLGSGLIPHGHC